MPIDDRTVNRNYKLPNAGNFLADDVQRLRDALTAIDADVFARYTKAETDQKLADLINGAPGALDTLNELAAAMGDDPNFAATITNALAGKPGFADVWTRAQADARYVQGVTQTENVFTGNGSQTTFALTQTPPTRESLLVTVDGVVQPTTAYNLSGSALILSEAPASGASIRVLMLGVAGPVQSASTLNFTQAGTSAITRTVDSKLKDVVSVKDFGAVGDGVANDTAAIQAAVNTGKAVFLPKGVYKLSSPITLATVGQRFFGETSQETYLTGGLNHDQLRIAASHCEVDHIHFRPDGSSNATPPAFAPLRIYAALAHVHDNRFLASASGSGTAIYMDDVDPATNAVIAGAYIHTISENRIGASGYEFKYGVYAYNNNNGQQATKIQNNQIMSDSAVYIHYGGGNYIVGNLLQSKTGTYVSPVGTGIAFGANVLGETITGNYIERYQYGVTTARAADQYLAFYGYGNHFDAVTNPFYSTATNNFAYFDEVSRYHYVNGWQHRYDSQDNYKLINREGIEVLNVNRAAYSTEPRVLAFNTFQSLGYTSNGQTLTPTSTWCEVTGAGAHRTGCFLGNGSRSGQILYLRGVTWSVQILNNPGGTQNIMFNGSAASATFGNGSGQVQTMQLIWDSTFSSGRWFEISRTVI